MSQQIISNNKNKKLDKPLWQLLCFSMFCLWQMGFIYFVGPSLTINGKTPLPIDTGNSTVLIAVCYVLSILWMIFLPQTIILTQRIVTSVALVTAVGLFFPMPDALLRILVYLQIFCCCFMIGFETFIMVNYFSESSNIRHLTVAYGLVTFLIAFLYNSFIPIDFPLFRFVIVAAIFLFLIFLFHMPVGREGLPQYIKKGDGLNAPKRMIFGCYVLVFVSALMGVSGPAISGEQSNGVFITYLTDAVACFTIYAIYKRVGIHPFKIIPFLIGAGAVGFVLMLAAIQVPSLAYIACGLIGIGMVPCQMLPLYGAVLKDSYPSKSISPSIIGLSLAAVLVQGAFVEAFRNDVVPLCLIYAVVMIVIVLIYMQIEPFFLFFLRKRGVDVTESEEKCDGFQADTDPLSVLTEKEREVAELICLGHTNGDIAKLLFITENTVKDHTKKIYPKMGVHSRFELAVLIGKFRSSSDSDR